MNPPKSDEVKIAMELNLHLRFAERKKIAPGCYAYYFADPFNPKNKAFVRWTMTSNGAKMELMTQRDYVLLG